MVKQKGLLLKKLQRDRDIKLASEKRERDTASPSHPNVCFEGRSHGQCLQEEKKLSRSTDGIQMSLPFFTYPYHSSLDRGRQSTVKGNQGDMMFRWETEWGSDWASGSGSFFNSLLSLGVGVSSINFLFPQKHPSLHDASSSSSTTCLLFSSLHRISPWKYTRFDQIFIHSPLIIWFPHPLAHLPPPPSPSLPSSLPSHFNYEDGWVSQACFFPGFSFCFPFHTLLVYS